MTAQLCMGCGAAVVRQALPQAVEVSGLQGCNSSCINGVYAITAEQRRGAPVYRRRGDGEERWLLKTALGWAVQHTEDKDADTIVREFITTGDSRHALSPLDVAADAWKKYDADAKKWVRDAGTYVGEPRHQQVIVVS